MTAHTTWVCFPCRRAARSTAWIQDETPRCPECGQELTRLSPKAEIPPRKDEKAWRAMRDAGLAVRDRDAALAPRRVARIHELERRIDDLRRRPDDADRRRLIGEIEGRIERLRGML